MRPYRARASAKIRIRIIPTNSLGCCALALHETSTQKQPSNSESDLPHNYSSIEGKIWCCNIFLSTLICAWTGAQLNRYDKAEASDVTPDTSVTNNANGHACCQACQATGEASCQVSIAIKEVVRLVRGLVDCDITNWTSHAAAKALNSLKLVDGK
jgi:hypothetical protein